MSKLIQNLKNHLINLPGWRTDKKIVVFESDDWGAIRMVSKEYFDKLLQAGIRVDLSKYDTLDSLENKEDLENLISILGNYHNEVGLSPKFTFNTVMANPDFQRIKEEDFRAYYYRPFFQSYKDYHGNDLEPLWREAIQEKLIQPQFHAREHLNVSLWMKDLQNGLYPTKQAFEFEFFALKTQTSSPFQKSYLAAYWAETQQELVDLRNIVKDGLSMFESTFGFKSCSFIAANYVYPKVLEADLNALGIQFIQTQRGHIGPVIDQSRTKTYRHFMGECNAQSQVYSIRNVLFEPYLNQKEDWVNITMNEINRAFFWKKPAIISSHRVNYVSAMSMKHRDDSLKKLDKLLFSIVKKWPDVIFLSSDELGQLIQESHHDSHPRT